MTTATLEKTNQAAVPVKNERRTVIPEYKINQANEAFEILVYMPGVTQSNLDIQLEDQWMKITGAPETLDTSGLKPLHVEFTECNYECEFKIPNQIDREGITAKLENGVLRLGLPKAKEHKRRNITVNAS